MRDSGRSSSYDAFLSYSHALDGRLAPVLQRELEQFAKPWYQVRSLRVFRDNASLTANPGLWSSIERALANSAWFVLLASPDAATSPWVDREVSWWLANRSAGRLLIVLTEGELVWDAGSGDAGSGDAGSGDFDWSATTALPPALRGALAEDPRWVDLRWLQHVEHVDRSNPRLRDCVADVAAALRGMPKDALVGEHIRQHRRAMRLARGGVTALALLLVATVVAATVAVGQRNHARDEARIATARQLAALAVTNLATHLDRAQLLAAAGYRLHPDPQTRSALFQAVAASPHLVRYLPAGAPVTTVAGSADGTVALAGTTDGHVLRWDLARGTRTTMRIGRAPITSLATDAGGARVLAADGTTAVRWDTATGRRRTIHSGASALVAVSPSGKRMAVLDRSADAAIPAEGGVGLTVYDGDTGRQLTHASLPWLWTRLGMPDDATVMLLGSRGSWERRSAADLGVLASMASGQLAPASVGTGGYSAAGRYYGVDVFGQASGWDLAASPGDSRFDHPDLQATTGAREPEVAEAFTISNDGTRMATAAAGTIYVATTSKQDADADADAVPLTGNDYVNSDAVAFLGDEQLISATGDTLTLWNLAAPGRFGADLGVQLPYGCSACGPRLITSPDDRRVVFVTIEQAAEYRLDSNALPLPDVLAGPAGPTNGLFPDGQTLPLWAPDGQRLVLLGLGDGSALVWDPKEPDDPISRWPSATPGTDPVTARVSADGSTVVVVNSHGDVVVRRFSDGTVERTFAGSGDLDTIGFPPPPAAATISADLTTAALVDEHAAVTFVDLRTGTRRTLPGGAGNGALFTQDKLLVLRPTGALEAWDVTGHRLLSSTSEAGAYLPVLAAPERGDVVARLRSDNVVVLSEPDSGVTLGSFPLPTSRRGQTAMRFTWSGTQLVVGRAGGRLTRWDLTADAWLRAACTSAGRDLSPAEWRQYVGTTAVPEELACRQ